MKIKSIEATNIKGLAHEILNLDLLPNKPNILVAPNGFGKSSLSIGFDSLKKNKIELDERFYHNGDDANRPILSLTIEDAVGTRVLIADDTQNTISSDFDVFVINSQLMAKATKMNIGGNTIVKSSLEITPTILVGTIPPKASFNYSAAQEKVDFGVNSKVLSNIADVFTNPLLVWKIVTDVNLSKFDQVRISKKLQEIKDEINQQQGSAAEIKQWIEVNKLGNLQAMIELNTLASILLQFDIPTVQTPVDSFLAAFQFVNRYKKLGADFKKAVAYILYSGEKEYYQKTISNFNTTRIPIKPKEDKKKGLIVEWPKAHEISNGQRDVLSFITLLIKAKRNFKKQNCILIIDEIFDYLDDANLISFQYFITTMIEELKGIGRNFFPILMTHLDPLFFNHFCFSRHKMKVVYLKNIPYHSNPNLLNLIKKREDATIKANVDKHHFHFYPTNINIGGDFDALGLPASWGDSQRFHQFINNELQKYLLNQTDYDPLAICFAVRVRIESLLYAQIAEPLNQQEFLNKHGTKIKLEFCEGIGLAVPETYYLLGLIYNDKLHWRNGLEIIRPVAIKLENVTIKKLIRDIFT